MQDPDVNVCYVCMNMTQWGKKKRKEQKFFPGQTHGRKLEGTQEKTKPPSTLKGFSKVAASIKSLFGYRSSSGFDFLNVKKKKIYNNKKMWHANRFIQPRSLESSDV